MRIDYTSDLWWKNAIVYCLDVETYSDSDGDGVGDFRGLIDKVDYLAGLGVTCVWLMPFYPSPNRDDGYDISDYYAVDPRLGSLGVFVELGSAASVAGSSYSPDPRRCHARSRTCCRSSACRVALPRDGSSSLAN